MTQKLLAAVVVLATFGLAACSDAQTSGEPAAGTQQSITVTPDQPATESEEPATVN